MTNQLRAALAADPDTRPYVDALRVYPQAAVDDVIEGPAEPRTAPGTEDEDAARWRIEGTVGSLAARRKAARIARRVLGNVEIEDGVRLAPEIRRSDPALAAALRTALAAEPALHGVRILAPGSHPQALHQPWMGVLVREGVVYLGGWLDNLAAKALAEALAWETGACCDVKNLIACCGESGSDRDAQIAAAAATLLHEHPRLAAPTGDLSGAAGDIAPIAVQVAHGELTLTGTVRGTQERELARSLCWLVPGVREVHDRLAVHT